MGSFVQKYVFAQFLCSKIVIFGYYFIIHIQIGANRINIDTVGKMFKEIAHCILTIWVISPIFMQVRHLGRLQKSTLTTEYCFFNIERAYYEILEKNNV